MNQIYLKNKARILKKSNSKSPSEIPMLLIYNKRMRNKSQELPMIKMRNHLKKIIMLQSNRSPKHLGTIYLVSLKIFFSQ